VPFIELASSALAPDASPVHVYYRDAGAGPPIVILHGGWGYEIYPFERQIAALGASHRLIAPDRTGYGRSGRIERQATDFHHRAAAESLAVIGALGLDRPVVWGHSDGAVIALLIGLADPDCLRGLIVEAAHFLRRKPASREFFEAMMTSPDDLGERVTAVLARDHGDGWRDLIRSNGDAWLRIANDASAPAADLYGGRLGDLRVPTLVIHGARDPRTEPGELDALREALSRNARAARHFAVLPEGGHSPHSERATADDVTQVAQRFLRDLQHAAADRPDPSTFAPAPFARASVDEPDPPDRSSPQ
jgi:pimeloyl-ACP methyl ester carboxylesterase